MSSDAFQKMTAWQIVEAGSSMTAGTIIAMARGCQQLFDTHLESGTDFAGTPQVCKPGSRKASDIR
jgi:hypothetical protein